jgi:outer membrane protein insertion porin family
VGEFLYAQDGVPTVTSVTIRGQKRIELQAIEGRLTLKAHDRFTADALREQVKILYGTGYFEDVQVETEPDAGGVSVGFIVREKPFITEIVFDGNEELSDDKLKEKITIKSQTFLDQQQAKESAEKIRLAYQEDGFFNCQVIPVIQAVDEDRKRLTYFVKEGTKAKVRRINFEGMRAVTKEEMFKVTATREWIPWYGLITQMKVPSLLSDAGVLKREELGNDIERMREVYLNKGYLNVQISQPTLELTDDKKWFEISYQIVEGEPFIVEQVGFRGNTVFEDHELREGLNIRAGEIFQRAKIRGEITRITDLYGAKGYVFAVSCRT